MLGNYYSLRAEHEKAVKYFRQPTRYRNPEDKEKSLFKYAFETKMHYFDWMFMPGHEEDAEAFNNHMKEEEQVKLNRSWRGCDSTTVTLKSGIERMLMHYIPEVRA